ncbi:GNAT family N-acetyltransferase [Candidatus Poribacteria bacterium]|nr:GNAT family N-acetyltransferase [Candidatus Poribacteria bacterium]
MNDRPVGIDIDSSRERIRLDDVQEMLSKAYWCRGITENEIKKGMDNSALVVGAYLPEGRQIGFLRVISDKVRFAYLLDVIVHDEHRGRGMGRRMVRFAISHPELKDVYQWVLITKDAHGVYEKLGFQALQDTWKWMSKWKARPERKEYDG